MKEFSKHRTSNVQRQMSNGIKCTTVCLLLFSIIFMSCTKNESTYKESRVLMDTYCTITVVASSSDKAAESINAGFAEIEKLDGLLNFFSDESEVAAINKASKDSPARVSSETLEMLEMALNISKATSGAFDPTVAPLMGLWKFPKNRTDHDIPSDISVNNARALVDFRKIVINSETFEVYLDMKGMKIDLGGIAKGYAADKAVDALRKNGIKAALVAVAGDIRGYGFSKIGKSWKVGIQNPRPMYESDKPWEEVMATLNLEDKAISTSGDYQRYFIKEGKRYHHIIDPETGYPAETDLISASVIAPEGYISDGVSTAVFVLGVENGMKLLESMKVMGVEGVLVDREKRVIVTEGLKGKLEILNDSYRP